MPPPALSLTSPDTDRPHPLPPSPGRSALRPPPASPSAPSTPRTPGGTSWYADVATPTSPAFFDARDEDDLLPLPRSPGGPITPLTPKFDPFSSAASQREREDKIVPLLEKESWSRFRGKKKVLDSIDITNRDRAIGQAEGVPKPPPSPMKKKATKPKPQPAVLSSGTPPTLVKTGTVAVLAALVLLVLFATAHFVFLSSSDAVARHHTPDGMEDRARSRYEDQGDVAHPDGALGVAQLAHKCNLIRRSLQTCQHSLSLLSSNHETAAQEARKDFARRLEACERDRRALEEQGEWKGLREYERKKEEQRSEWEVARGVLGRLGWGGTTWVYAPGTTTWSYGYVPPSAPLSPLTSDLSPSHSHLAGIYSSSEELPRPSWSTNSLSAPLALFKPVVFRPRSPLAGAESTVVGYRVFSLSETNRELFWRLSPASNPEGIGAKKELKFQVSQHPREDGEMDLQGDFVHAGGAPDGEVVFKPKDRERKDGGKFLVEIYWVGEGEAEPKAGADGQGEAEHAGWEFVVEGTL